MARAPPAGPVSCCTRNSCAWKEVSSLGGTGVAIATDHLQLAQVQDLAARLRAEYGQIDVLVNDLWGAEWLKGAGAAPRSRIYLH